LERNECQQPREGSKAGEQASRHWQGGCLAVRKRERCAAMKRCRPPRKEEAPAGQAMTRNRPWTALRLTLRVLAKNTLISSSCSSNDLRTLPASLPVHHLLSAPTITTENSEHIIIPTRNIQQGQASQAPSSNFAPPSRSPNRASSAQLYIAKLRVAEPYELESHFSYVALPSPSSFPQGERIDGSCVSPAT
jgi:hypothetical protein